MSARPCRQSSTLGVFDLDISTLTSVVDEWYFGNSTHRSGNQYLIGHIHPLSDEDLHIPVQHEFGHCWIYEQRLKTPNNQIVKKVKLLEGGTNDAPRWMYGSRKIPIYHILARVSAYKTDNNPDFLRPTTFSERDLLQVSPTKANTGPEVYTLMHLCGNKWCMNHQHYHIGKKRYNDQQTSCHLGLHNVDTEQQYKMIQQNYCKHAKKCWANVYSEFNVTAKFFND